MLSKGEPELDDLEDSQPIHIAKNEKACSNTNGVMRLSLDKEFTGLHEQKHCQFELKGTEMGQNEGQLLDLLNWTGQSDR